MSNHPQKSGSLCSGMSGSLCSGIGGSLCSGIGGSLYPGIGGSLYPGILNSFKEHFFDLVNSSLKPAISPYFSHLIIFPEKMYKSSLDEFVSNVIQIIVLNDRFSENNEILFFDPIVENNGFEMYVIENNINRLIPFGLKRKTVEVFLS